MDPTTARVFLAHDEIRHMTVLDYFGAEHTCAASNTPYSVSPEIHYLIKQMVNWVAIRRLRNSI